MTKVNTANLNSANEFEEAERFWLNKISGNLTDLRLISDFPGVANYEKDSMEVTLKDDLTQRLTQLSKNNDLSFYIMLMVCFKLLLHKYTGQDEVITLSPLFNESNKKYNEWVIFRDFVNSELTFKEFLMSVRQTVVEGYQNEFYPVKNIIDILDINKSSLFRHILVLENIHGKEFTENVIANGENDIIFSFLKSDGLLVGEITYNALMFKKETIQIFINSFSRILEQVLFKTDIKISDIDLLAGKEKNKVLFTFNDSKKLFPNDKLIHQLFEEQVAKTPGNTAIRSTLDVRNVYDKEKYRKVDIYLSYEELNERANQLAHELRIKGVTADSIVGVLVDHPLEIVVSILGILKSGGAYLPLDVSHPEKFMATIIENSGMQHLVTNEALEDKIPGTITLKAVVFVDDEIADENTAANLEPINNSSNLAYVIYTSGTTGKPKGTLVEHRGVVNYTRFRIESYNCTESDVTLQPLSYCFDGFTSNFYSTLLSGGTLFMVPDSKRMEFQYMREVIKDYKVTNVSLVPGIYNAILEISEKSDLESLRFVVLAGDKCGLGMVEKSKEKASNALLINEYGPTEATVTAVANLGITEDNTSIIGKPISNASIYILDRFQKPVPVYIAGEMFIGGAGVVREYLGNPELTAENFLENPFVKGERMYRTGDFARWLPDGNIEFLGRLDKQVKTRGFRVELGQIEHVLLSHEKISEAVVLAKETKIECDAKNNDIEKFLCAYFVSETELASDDLREFMTQELPDYMIPVHFVAIEKMPLTRNGKKDTKALLELDTNQKTEENIPPRTETEIKLVEIWAEVLKISKDEIYINSNFFAIGGHSLNATTLVYKIHKVLNVKLSVADIFDYSTLIDLSEYVDSASADEWVVIEKADNKEFYPLSPAQKRLYILNQMDSSHTGYNSPQIIALESPGENNKLESVFKQLIQRHEALRTSFEMIEGESEPIQRIHDEIAFNIENVELEESDVEKTLKNFVQPFDLSQAPLLRVAVINVADQMLLLVDMHHIISDAITHELLINDFLSLYEGEELPELKFQYKDFSEWKNQQQGSSKLKDQERYWLEVFDQEPSTLNLPYDFPRPAIKSFEGKTVSFEIGKKETGALRQLADEGGSTLYMAMLGIYNVLLSKLCNSDDIVIGTPVAGRLHADLEKVVGLFVNTILLRNYPNGDKAFNLFSDEVKEGTLKAFDNQEYQFEDLIEKIKISRDTSRNPLFDVMFTYIKNEMESDEEVKNDNLWKDQKKYTLESNISKFDLTLTVTEMPDHLICGFEYCTKLFKEETIHRFVKYMKNILSTVLADPFIKISDVKILSDEEKTLQLINFNDTARDYPHDETIMDLFEARVERAPDDIAVTNYLGSGDQPLTYGQLNKISNQLASLLQAKGVKTDTIVGIKTQRSMEMIIGIWAVLKAGAAYLPIDPNDPQERINYMLNDSNVSLILTDGSGTPMNSNIDVIDLTSVDVQEYQNPPARLAQSNNLAYVIYTSGSTGNPKGTMIQHHSLVNRLNWMQQQYLIGPGDVILQKTIFTFDVSVWELFWWSMTGAALCLLGPGDEKNPEAITAAIENKGVTTMHFVPSMLEAYLDFVESANVSHKLAGLKQVFASGEVLKVEHVNRFKRILHETNGTLLYNLYGPTEATIDVSYYSCPMTEDFISHQVPIGKPIDNTQLYIVDRNLKLQPLGVPGELCIAGDGLARGYLNQPELTAEKFVTWCPQDSSSFTIYRTGDLARLLPNGVIEFLGRMDNQVKIRGFRIELGEIETRLLEHSVIKEVVLLAREEDGREKYLCAYVVANDKINPAELKSYLSGKLSAHMVPTHIVQLEQLPLKANGKVDKRKLPAPEVKFENYVTATTDIEKVIAGVWQEALKLEKISIHENFFEVGGNSLLLLKVVDQLKKALKRDISSMVMFEHSTISAMAQYLNREDNIDVAASKEQEAAVMMEAENSMNEAVQMFDEV
jgi:tyrocidine synthetase III